ncbi:MAG: sulfatase-like hydrolase/transferase [Planctomycetales bacterium]|nr:sulfatase-like hydrolase/transferase [Planctomycetales bacterium]
MQAYLATGSFCDAQVGRLLDALEASEHRDNTIVCLWSDHGWSLGEKEHWRKFALWEEPTRSVLVWRAPGVTVGGKVCERPVDLMCVYPTLCALTGVPTPSHVEGVDISSLLRDPEAPWATPALTTFRRNNHSVRSENARYIRYADGGEELYDHVGDPHEYRNVANDASYAALKQELRARLPERNAPGLPKSKAKADAARTP